jgi:hypothetical protein
MVIEKSAVWWVYALTFRVLPKIFWEKRLAGETSAEDRDLGRIRSY